MAASAMMKAAKKGGSRLRRKRIRDGVLEQVDSRAEESQHEKGGKAAKGAYQTAAGRQ